MTAQLLAFLPITVAEQLLPDATAQWLVTFVLYHHCMVSAQQHYCAVAMSYVWHSGSLLLRLNIWYRCTHRETEHQALYLGVCGL